MDARDGEVMFAKRPDRERPIASATKLMTALVLLDARDPLDRVRAAAYHAGPSSRRSTSHRRADDGRRPAAALLLESANDAAVALAEDMSGSREAFVADMNARASSAR